MGSQTPCTDFATVRLPAAENALSRRYLGLLLDWLPMAQRAFNPWPERPRCGHFFGGVFWYGLETSRPMLVLALSATSAEFDAERAGATAAEVRQMALQALRYLCFTHDTGPPACVRPMQSWGRQEPAGSKWGERGQGFFRESQCGVTLAHLALSAALLQDLLGDEERHMLAAIAADYLGRFGAMTPRAGVYNNTQTEENAWTALGLVASLLLLGQHEPTSPIWANVKRWMFCTATRPQDAHDPSLFADGQAVRDLCGGIVTTLPDGTAENHGVVHPNYMATAVGFAGETGNLLHLYQHPIPPHLSWRRQESYVLLKRWCDTSGAPHSPQGMDWPYFAYPEYGFLHTAANIYGHDADAARFEDLTLQTLEQAGTAHGGARVPAEASQHCHGLQDPAFMLEGATVSLAQSYLAHRLCGAGEPPTPPEEMAVRLQGVYVYPHGGALVHRHPRGQTSLSWRNRTMVLPATREGIKLIAPHAGAMLARIVVRDRAPSSCQVALCIREASDHVGVLLSEDLAQDSVRRQVLFASLPDGKCLLVERLLARQALTVDEVVQGCLGVINDGYFGVHPQGRSQRHLFWEGGVQVCPGYAADSAADDVFINIRQSRWINIDDRCGLVFRGSGRSRYHNRHLFPVWRAVEDELILSLQDEIQVYQAGEEIASLITLWCPEQTHAETARQALIIHDSPSATAVVIEVDGYLCAGNWGASTVTLPQPVALPAGQPWPLAWGVTGSLDTDVWVTLRLHPGEPMILALADG